ncbi:MAG: tetratricopeptide repeat protein, partial [Ferruginibacter sp.]
LHSRTADNQSKGIFIKGLYYSFSGDKVKALSFFDTCLKINYRDILAYREKAICLYDLNKFAAALEVLKQAITVQKSFDEGYYWMGRCYEKLGNKKEAIESYQLALQIDPDYVEAKEGLGRVQ